MDKREQFKHYMLAGHGRAAKLLDGNEECFRDIVLYGCLNDISYDLQCEGSRGWFVYNLVQQYDDPDYFLNRAIEKFLFDETVDYWHIVNHLGDFIECFAADGIQSAKDAIEEKYARLYGQLLSAKKNLKAVQIRESYEYLAITIIQRKNLEQTLRVFADMGAYFLKHNRTADYDLKWPYEWFWECAREVYGEVFLKSQLEEKSKSSKELGRFKRVMFTAKPERQRPERPKPTAEQMIELAGNKKSNKWSMIRMHFAEDSEKIKLANAVLEEADLQKKAKLLSAFTIPRNVFPLSPEPIVEYAKSRNKMLRKAALDALAYLKADCVHDFAVEQLKKENSNSDALEILINNFREEDKALLLESLENLPIDQDDSGGWHGVVMTIRNSKNCDRMPDEAILFVYEKSRCSCCRENILDKMKKRNLLTKEILNECLCDSDLDIRKKAKELQENT